jgi:predicted RNA binding protein YcfA (HicA-like mRNA interferase family)
VGRRLPVYTGLYTLERVSSEERKRWLKKHGCRFGKQEGSHLKVYRANKFTILPMHGKKELKLGTLRAILRDLDLEM